MIAAFSEGKGVELASSAFIIGNSIFYLFFYQSYGENAYDKYFYFKKAYPEISYYNNTLRLSLNFKF